MVQAPVANPISFEAFLEWYPEDGRRYELIQGVVIEMLPTGSHEDVGGSLEAKLNFAIRQHQLPYSIPRTCLIKPQAEGGGYMPDVVILNRELLQQEPLWPTASVIQSGKPIPLVIEVVSSNWRDDYGHKFVEYEYQMRRFVAGEKLVSGVFPQLDLTTDAVFAAGSPHP